MEDGHGRTRATGEAHTVRLNFKQLLLSEGLMFAFDLEPAERPHARLTGIHYIHDVASASLLAVQMGRILKFSRI